MADLPDGTLYGTVVGQFIQAVADSADPDREPDSLPMSGTVTFTPAATRVALPDTVPNPVTMFQKTITATLDSEGYLVGPDGQRGILLIASDSPGNPTDFTYSVAVSLSGVQTFSFSFFLNAGATVDLTTVIPATSQPGFLVPTDDLVASFISTPGTVTNSELSATIAVEAKDATGTPIATFPAADMRTLRAPMGDSNARAGVTPNFRRIENHLLDFSEQPLNSWTGFVVVRAEHEGATSKYLVFYAPDHGTGNQGVCMLRWDGPGTPMTVHGIVYADNIEGKQTETPDVHWVPEQNRYVMFYQQDMIATRDQQLTLWATSPDGITWTRQGIAIDGQGLVWVKDTSYAKVSRIGGKWVAHHLIAAGARAVQGISWSDDLSYWFTDPNPIYWDINYSGMDGALDSDFKVSWVGTRPFLWGGQYWTLVTATPFGTFGGQFGGLHLTVAPLSDDMRSFAAPPVRTNLTDVLPDEGRLGGGPGNLFLHDDGYLYGLYMSSEIATPSDDWTRTSIGLIRSEA